MDVAELHKSVLQKQSFMFSSVVLHPSLAWYSFAQLLTDTSTPKTSSEIRSEPILLLAFRLRHPVLKHQNMCITS